ncbi:hypothetical protein Cgig2_027536 [Carnegiea gigantea]|uniref:Uncharacterized protein n=1 Tax=Carnegiea gigantea TaxID=171969 RepID=A0A9Q1GRY7_9CARY|nr:hypothetical protein Cgig2_027536 [Carnegiea gigantea]
MAGFFLKPSGSTRGHSRSISLPVRSHPTTIKIEQELNNLILNLQLSSSSQPCLKADKLCMAITGLSELYKSTGEVLKLPQTQQALAFTKHDQASSWVDEILEEPLSFLDVCGNTRENVSLLRETLGNLQSALRRSTSSTSNNVIDNVTHYVSSLKSFKREMEKSLASLKQIDTKLAVSPTLNSCDQQLVAVVRVLRETSLMSSIIFRAILGYFSGSSNSQPKASKWSLVLKLVNNKDRKLDDNLNELEDVEVALNSLVVQKDGSEMMMIMMIRSTSKKLQVLEKIIEGVEMELDD